MLVRRPLDVLSERKAFVSRAPRASATVRVNKHIQMTRFSEATIGIQIHASLWTLLYQIAQVSTPCIYKIIVGIKGYSMENVLSTAILRTYVMATCTATA